MKKKFHFNLSCKMLIIVLVKLLCVFFNAFRETMAKQKQNVLMLNSIQKNIMMVQVWRCLQTKKDPNESHFFIWNKVSFLTVNTYRSQRTNLFPFACVHVFVLGVCVLHVSIQKNKTKQKIKQNVMYQSHLVYYWIKDDANLTFLL